MKDDCTTNSHYLMYTFLFRKVGRMHFLNLGVKGLTEWNTPPTLFGYSAVGLGESHSRTQMFQNGHNYESIPECLCFKSRIRIFCVSVAWPLTCHLSNFPFRIPTGIRKNFPALSSRAHGKDFGGRSSPWQLWGKYYNVMRTIENVNESSLGAIENSYQALGHAKAHFANHEGIGT